MRWPATTDLELARSAGEIRPETTSLKAGNMPSRYAEELGQFSLLHAVLFADENNICFGKFRRCASLAPLSRPMEDLVFLIGFLILPNEVPGVNASFGALATFVGRLHFW